MKKIILGLMILSIISLSSCVKGKLIKVEQDNYVILNVDPPKRVYIDLKRVSDGEIFKSIYLTKRMSSWKNIVIGDTIKLKRYTYKFNDLEQVSFNETEILEILISKYNL